MLSMFFFVTLLVSAFILRATEMPAEETLGNTTGFKDYLNSIWCTFITVMTSKINIFHLSNSWLWRLLPHKHPWEIRHCLCDVLGQFLAVFDHCLDRGAGWIRQERGKRIFPNQQWDRYCEFVWQCIRSYRLLPQIRYHQKKGVDSRWRQRQSWGSNEKSGVQTEVASQEV